MDGPSPMQDPVELVRPAGGQELNQAETLVNPERQHIVDQVGIATATLYPGWYHGEVADGQEPSTDKLRGDLALDTIGSAVSQGFRIVVVDGGSSADFIDALSKTTALVEPQAEDGMSVGRQQAFETVSGLDGVGVICWVEPEKVSLVTDGIIDPARAIIDDEADIVIPARDQAAFDSYPDFQTTFEQDSNHLFNGILRRHDLRSDDDPDLDMWFGPRFFRNTPEVVGIFKKGYEYVHEVQAGVARDTVGLWPNALFLPIIAALKQGYRVASVPVDYRHPTQQTLSEQNSPKMVDKRAFQQRTILTAAVNFVRMLEDDRLPRLREIGRLVSQDRPSN